MNGGMFGLPSEQGLGGRKITAIGQSPGAVQLLTGSSLSAYSASVGRGPWTLAALTAGVRTRVLAISGRGALRVHMQAGDTAGSTDLTTELLVDGVTVRSVTATYASTSAILAIVGSITPSATGVILPDFVPFDSSLEIYVTASVTRSTVQALTIYDLYQ